MSISTERAQQLLQLFEQLKQTILDIDKKYSLNYQEPQLDLPPSLDLQPLEYVPKTQEQLVALARADVSPNHTNKVRNLEQSYLRQKQSLEGKKLRLAESSRKKLEDLLKKYNEDIKKLRRRLVNNGLIYSSVVTKYNDDALQGYNEQVSQSITHFDNLLDEVDVQLEQLQSRYNQGLNSLDDELGLRIHQRLQELLLAEQKEQERIAKYNTTLSEKETKDQASCQKALEYARQSEYDRALKAAQLYAQLGESGVEAQKISEKYNYCKQYFRTWLKEEALFVIQSDSFLSGHLGNYYVSLVDWVNANLP